MFLIPRLAARRRIRARLAVRSPKTIESWLDEVWSRDRVPEAIVRFVYEHLAAYSGLDFSRVRPQDRLVEDLDFAHVTYKDWEFDLAEDFESRFGVSVRDFPAATLNTVDDWVRFLTNVLRGGAAPTPGSESSTGGRSGTSSA